jgi:ABC-type branched-subunit amino acid transport system substrate-binding protein
MDRRDYLKAVAAVGTAGTAGLAGCTGGGGGGDSSGGGGSSGGDSGGDGGSSSSGDSGGSGGNSYTVGVITARSGSYSFLGKGEYQGAVLAKRDLEEELGVSIEIIEADTETDPATGLERMKRLVNEDQVDFVLGGVSSSVAIKMGTWASDNGVAYMAAGSHSDATTGSKCAEYMFRPTTSNSMLANALGGGMADYADSWFLMYADYTWGQSGRAAVKNVLGDTDAEIVGEKATPFPSDDYTQYLNEAANSGAEGLAVIVAGTDQRIVTKQFLNKGLNEEMKMAGPLFEEAVFWGLSQKAAAQAGLWATPWAASVPSSEFGEEFKSRVAEEFDASPFSRHYMGYTSMYQLVSAAERAGSVAAEDVRSELEGYELDHSIKQGTNYFREGDHQLVQPVDTVESLPVSEQQTDPYNNWTEHVSQVPGDEVARPVSETGCSL